MYEKYMRCYIYTYINKRMLAMVQVYARQQSASSDPNYPEMHREQCLHGWPLVGYLKARVASGKTTNPHVIHIKRHRKLCICVCICSTCVYATTYFRGKWTDSKHSITCMQNTGFGQKQRQEISRSNNITELYLLSYKIKLSLSLQHSVDLNHK